MSFGKIFIFGDSYSTYEGIIPEGYATYYSENCETMPGRMALCETWWQRLIDESGSELLMNNSWSGSTIGYTTYEGRDGSLSSSFIFRLRRLARLGFFANNKVDTLFVFGGTNDSWSEAPLGEMKYEGVTERDLYTVLPAICVFMRELRETLPKTKIVCLINTEIKNEVRNALAEAAERNGAIPVWLEDIDKENGHPTSLGMEQIKTQVMNALK